MNDHLTAIRRAANDVGRLHDSDLSLDIIWHTDALAKQLAEAEARADTAYGDGYHQALYDVRQVVASLSDDAGVARLISVKQGKFRPMDDDASGDLD